MTVCEEIAGWAASLRKSDLPASVVDRARLQHDAVLAAGRAGEDAALAVAAGAPDGVLGEIHRGAAASIAHDWDDYLYMGHTGHSAVWASRAFAGGGDPLVAQVAANEVAGRLGAALLLGPHNGQFWSSIHCAGGAIGAGIAMGLGPDRLAHALGIALYQPPFGLWPGFMGPPTKLLTAADPAVQGARAALLAADGLDGPLDVIEHPRGLLRHFSYVPRPRMLGALGEVWLTDTLAFKPSPGCAYVQAPIAAALAAGVSAAEVESVDVDAGLLTTAMDGLNPSPPLTAVGVNFSTPLSVAVALVAGRMTHAELTPAWLAEHETAIRALAARVRVHHDWEMTLRTARGTLDGSASLRDVPPKALPRLIGHLRELGPAPGMPPLRDLLALGRRARGASGPPGIAGIDTSRLRMTFPARLHIRTREGRTHTFDGEERGACGSPIAEQRAVVDARRRAVESVAV